MMERLRNDIPPTKNALLAALPPSSRRRVLAKARFVAIDPGEVLYAAHEPIESLLFPVAGLISIVVPADGNKEAEVAMVGPEGAVGITLLFGMNESPMMAVAQSRSSCIALSAADFRDELRKNAPFSRVLHAYASGFLGAVAQATLCVHVHQIEQRCARWLLMAQDRLGSETFELTQESFSRILGVRRSSISEVAGGLQRKGIIRYSRGKLTVLDREGLVAASCGCYERILKEYGRCVRCKTPAPRPPRKRKRAE